MLQLTHPSQLNWGPNDNFNIYFAHGIIPIKGISGAEISCNNTGLLIWAKFYPWASIAVMEHVGTVNYESTKKASDM